MPRKKRDAYTDEFDNRRASFWEREEHREWMRANRSSWRTPPPPISGVRTYLVQSGESGPVKIGTTAGPARLRMDALQIGNPEQLYLRCELEGNREAELHKRFAHLRIRGEWFRVDDELQELMSSDAITTMEGQRGTPSSRVCGLGSADPESWSPELEDAA